MSSPAAVLHATRTRAEPDRPAARILELDGLRAFAILAVMLHHSWPKGYWFSFAGDAGWMGVDLFFVLSGYLITGILLKSLRRENGYRNFIVRRALRIFPLYFLSLGIFTAFIFFKKDHASWELMKSWGGVSWFLIYLGNLRAAWMNSLPPVLSFATLWSLQVEEQFYILFPIAVARLSVKNLRLFLLTSIVFAPVLRLTMLLISPHNSIAAYALMPCRMDALAMGAWVAATDKLPRASHARFAFLSGALVAAAIFFASLANPAGSAYGIWMQSAGYSAVDFTCAALLCWILASRESGRAGWLRFRPLTCTGQIAYGLYLLHEPASAIARRLLGNIETHSVLSVPITLMSAFAVAAFSWRFFESPFLALKERWGGA